MARDDQSGHSGAHRGVHRRTASDNSTHDPEYPRAFRLRPKPRQPSDGWIVLATILSLLGQPTFAVSVVFPAWQRKCFQESSISGWWVATKIRETSLHGVRIPCRL